MKKNTSVIVIAHSQFRGIYVEICKLLTENFGAIIHLFVASDQEKSYYSNINNNTFTSITVCRNLYFTSEEKTINRNRIIDTAKNHENAYGITINSLTVSDRHLGRGYSLGGFKHPRSRVSEKINYIKMLDIYNNEIEFWENFISKIDPEFILNPGTTLSILADKLKIPTRSISCSRFENYYYWGTGQFLESPQLETSYKNVTPDMTLQLDAPYAAMEYYNEKYVNGTTLLNTSAKFIRKIAEHIYWNARKFDKAKGYYLTEELTYMWNHRKSVRKMTSPRLPTLEDVERYPFVFFPLATEPETSLQALSPEYFYQLSAIAALSRDMPAGCLLVVKEHHFAAGRRPSDFYGQIQEFKNVELIGMGNPGLSVIERADAVATISGTSGFEAAALGRPVISFGQHNLYNFLPHVMNVTKESQIKGYLKSVFDGSYNKEQMKRDGKKFLTSVVDSSFDMLDFQPWEPDKIDQKAVEESFSYLLKSLPDNFPNH